MSAALAVAEEGLLAGELPIGSVVVANGVVVGQAHTQEHSQERLLVHAELLALDQADRLPRWDRASSTLYTTLEPCLMCLGAAATAMVGRVVFALPAPSDGAARLAEHWERSRSRDVPHARLPAVVAGIGRIESEALMERFIAQRRDNGDPLARWVRTLLAAHD